MFHYVSETGDVSETIYYVHVLDIVQHVVLTEMYIVSEAWFLICA